MPARSMPVAIRDPSRPVSRSKGVFLGRCASGRRRPSSRSGIRGAAKRKNASSARGDPIRQRVRTAIWTIGTARHQKGVWIPLTMLLPDLFRRSLLCIHRRVPLSPGFLGSFARWRKHALERSAKAIRSPDNHLQPQARSRFCASPGLPAYRCCSPSAKVQWVQE